MLTKLRRHIAQQYMGFIALIVALSGTAYAVATVGSGDVIDDSLRSRDIKDGTITSIDVRNESVEGGGLSADDIRDFSLTGEKLGSYSLRSKTVAVAPNGGVGEVHVDCPASSRLLSGGAEFQYPSGDISDTHPYMITNPPGWIAEGQNNGQFEQNLTAWALCLPYDS